MLATNEPRTREIRVFISSTFRDMQEERDILIKKIFPQLRRLCEDRAVTWTEVDLRWGITDEQKAEGRVLPLCLEEIQRCQPYFIGLLGERYGWVPQPNSIPTDLMESHAWLKEHLQDSVTELEILHGVFSDERMHRHAYFYFRSPKYLEALPADKRPDFIAEGSEAASKLVKLKQRIRDASHEQVCELREEYLNPEQLGEWILEDFGKLVDQLYPMDRAPDPLDRESARHESYAQSRRLAFVGRVDLLRRLNEHAAAPGKPLVLTGESGCGKSGLLAEWVARWRANHPGDFVIQHYIGSTPESADWEGLVRRILSELKRSFAIIDDIPLQPDTLRFALNEWTVKVAGSRRIVLVLDALNQILADGAAQWLAWLPAAFPPHFRVLVSSLQGASLDTLRKRGWPEVNVPLFARADIAPAATAYLKIFSKTPPLDITAKLESAAAACNALYLRAVLDELRQFGKHDELTARASDYLRARNPTELYERIIARWEQDFGPELVRNALRHLWATREGLFEGEWLDLLGANDGPLPRQTFTPLFLAMAPHLVLHAGLYTFGHEFLRQAVQSQLLTDGKDFRPAHLELANYFENRFDSVKRRALELPYQLFSAGETKRLQLTISDILLAFTLIELDPDGLQKYWISLSQEREMGKIYVRSFQELDPFWDRYPEKKGYIAHTLSMYLFANPHFSH